MSILLDGISVANDLKKNISLIYDSKSIDKYPPCVVIIRFGNNDDDISYQNSAIRRCESFGVKCNVVVFDSKVSFSRFKELFTQYNDDKYVDGIIIMGKYPSNEIKLYVQKYIKQRKDIDGIGYDNIAMLYSNYSETILPCTAESVIRLLKFYQIDVCKKKICVLGRSLVIGKPLTIALLNLDATVSVCHSKTLDVKSITKSSDIIVCSVGIARYLTTDMVSSSSIIIDVGINFDLQGNICGDADFENLNGYVQAITPVPKGVGSITNMVLVSHILSSYAKR